MCDQLLYEEITRLFLSHNNIVFKRTVSLHRVSPFNIRM